MGSSKGFVRGSSVIEADEEAAQAARKAGFSDGRVPFFAMKAGATMYVRLLTPADGDEGWFKTAQHAGVQTKPAPADMQDKTKWPKQMGGVCRKDKQIASILNCEDCYVCDNKLTGFGGKIARATNKVWSLAVERVQVLGDGSEALGGPTKLGKVVGYGDVTEEYEVRDDEGKPSGVKALRPRIIVINMSWGNFFASLHHAYTTLGDVCERDFAIRRIGDGTDTDYHIMPLNPTPDLAPGTDAWKRYTDELERREIDLGEIILRQASDEHYARWFDPTKNVDKEGNITAASAADVASAKIASAGVGEIDTASQDKMDALRAKLMGTATT
jgi:hypothetical protein